MCIKVTPTVLCVLCVGLCWCSVYGVRCYPSPFFLGYVVFICVCVMSPLPKLWIKWVWFIVIKGFQM